MPLFKLFFEGATGNAPYDYQARLASGDDGVRCKSQLISIPTGLGKTAAVVLARLWNCIARSNAGQERGVVSAVAKLCFNVGSQ